MKSNLNNPILDNIHSSAFTIDVEDGVSIAMRDVFGKEVKQTERVVIYTRKILHLLEEYDVKATFFILGEVAKDFPFLVKEISNKGHEIGVHGFEHLQFFKMNPKQAFIELSTAKKILEDLSGREIRGHRAPAFSVLPETAWAFDVIASCGFKYDSSIIPIKGKKYGWYNFPKDIVKVNTTNGADLIEVPISSIKYFNKEIPFSGGSYLRLLPFQFINNAYKNNNKLRSNILYIHPYELDYIRYPKYYFESLEEVSLLKKLKMKSNWINRKKTYGKLEKLLINYSFTTMNNIVESYKTDNLIKELTVNSISGELTYK